MGQCQSGDGLRSIFDFFSCFDFTIPNYQRPYKWEEKNLNALLSDLKKYREKSAYRLGSLVFHRGPGSKIYDIVDGQQRTLTLSLLVKAIFEVYRSTSDAEKSRNISDETLKKDLDKINIRIEGFFRKTEFSNIISQNNLYNNYQAALRAVSRPDYTEEDIRFLLHKCEVVTFVLNDVSEAFQFFDSQNARGRDLTPHDLLKAFHLREFADHERALQPQTVSHWEAQDSEELARTFGEYLYRIRRWVKGQRSGYFDKQGVALFKGINLEESDAYPYSQMMKVAHHFTDDYNHQYQRKIDSNHMQFPFQLDQKIINGRRFFEMIQHYQTLIDQVVNLKSGADSQTMGGFESHLNENARKILDTLNSYSQRNRKGDRWVRLLFDCALVFYIDKFGTQQLSEAIEKLFYWIYRCRIINGSIGIKQLDKYESENGVFVQLQNVMYHQEVLNISLPAIIKSEVASVKGISDITNLFKDGKYYVEG